MTCTLSSLQRMDYYEFSFVMGTLQVQTTVWIKMILHGDTIKMIIIVIIIEIKVISVGQFYLSRILLLFVLSLGFPLQLQRVLCH